MSLFLLSEQHTSSGPWSSPEDTLHTDFIWASTQKFLPPRGPTFSEDIKEEKRSLGSTWQWNLYVAQSCECLWALLSWLTGGLSRAADAVKWAQSVPCPQKLTFYPLTAESQDLVGKRVFEHLSQQQWDLSSLPSAQKHKTTQEAEVICFIGHRIKKPGLPRGIRTPALCPSSQNISGSFDTHRSAGWPSERCPPPTCRNHLPPEGAPTHLSFSNPQANECKTLKVHYLHS